MAKNSPRTTAGELPKIVESRGQKTLKRNCQTAPTSPLSAETRDTDVSAIQTTGLLNNRSGE